MKGFPLRSRLLVAVLAFVLAATGCGTDSDKASATQSFVAPTVTVNTINGTGCPAGTATGTVLPDGAGVQVTYTAFTAKAGTGSTSTEFRRNCQLNVTLAGAGQTYKVSTAAHVGLVNAPAGGTVLQRGAYYLQGDPSGAPADHTDVGPIAGPWTVTDTDPYTAPCGSTRNLNVNTELRVSTPGPAASLSLTGSTINVAWSAC